MPELLAQRKCFSLPMRDEPITHIVEVMDEKKEYSVLVGTLNGWLFLVDLVESKILKRICLAEIGLTPHDLRLGQRKRPRTCTDNIVYFMGAYSSLTLKLRHFWSFTIGSMVFICSTSVSAQKLLSMGTKTASRNGLSQIPTCRRKTQVAKAITTKTTIKLSFSVNRR